MKPEASFPAGMVKSIEHKTLAGKPTESRQNFPHPTTRWAKKVRRNYFGKVSDDPQSSAAFELWLDQRDDLLAGRTPRLTSDGRAIPSDTVEGQGGADILRLNGANVTRTSTSRPTAAACGLA